MKKYTFGFLAFNLAISLFILSSCKNRKLNYITYYNKVNRIDSMYRFQKDTLAVIKKYRKLFRKYPPRNQERIEEYATYIKLSDLRHKRFGGQKSLYKLLPLLAPHNKNYKKLLGLYQKYGIDSLSVEREIIHWKRNLNKQLIDSFTIAMQRDQEGRPNDKAMVEKNVAKNVKLIVWTFENFGYPSSQKIGLMPMHTLLTHVNMTKEYPYVKTKLLEYVKSGDCPPISYAMMVDSYNIINKKQTIYGFDFKDSKDTLRVNRNRDSIGVPRLKHFAKIKKDFLQELKYEESKELH